MIDVDHFKEVNDEHGHDAGDSVLKALARTPRHSLRTDDAVFRLGGDEFLVLYPATDSDGGMQVARRILARVESLEVSTGNCRWHGSTSIGVAKTDSPSEADGTALLQSADQALYRPKDAGRGRVSC